MENKKLIVVKLYYLIVNYSDKENHYNVSPFKNTK